MLKGVLLSELYFCSNPCYFYTFDLCYPKSNIYVEFAQPSTVVVFLFCYGNITIMFVVMVLIMDMDFGFCGFIGIFPIFSILLI